MQNSFKKYWWLIAIGMLIIPVLLNFILLIPSFTPVVGNSVTWLSFWATFIGSIASFCMVFFTALSLKQNKSQFDEMKRQWEEEHRPHIVFDLVCQSGMYLLRIKNIGRYDATNVKLGINKDYHDILLNDSLRLMMDDFMSKELHIEAGGIRYIQIGITPNLTPCYFNVPYKNSVTREMAENWEKCHRNDPLIIKATYNGIYESKAILKLSDIPEYCLDLIDSEVKALDAINQRLKKIEGHIRDLKSCT